MSPTNEQNNFTTQKQGAERNCTTCFFGAIPISSAISPCNRCNDYDKYARDTIYFWGKEDKVLEEPKEEVTEPDYNMVSKPKHYMLLEDKGIEVRDVIEALVKKMENSKEYGFEAMDYSDYVQAMQYVMRFMDKNGIEDIKKAVWYFNKMITNWEDEKE